MKRGEVDLLYLDDAFFESDGDIKASDKVESKQPIHLGLGWEVVTEHL